MSLKLLRQSVQFNCDLSDREFAADYSICIYLIRMREYYRWSHGIAPNAPLDQSALMEWVSETEARWNAISADDFQDLTFQGAAYPPFDSDALNRQLNPLGYTYSAGYGRLGKPVFLLAEIESIETTEHYILTVAGRELARELSAPLAVMQKRNLLIRSEAVSRFIWDLLEEWQWHKPDNAMAELVKYYDFESQPIQALERASAEQQEVLILHEIGELIAEGMLSPDWNTMLSDDNQHREMFARAVRDYLADCLSTLPALLTDNNIPGLHFYFASLTPLRKSMYPTLANSYVHWRNGGSINNIKRIIKVGQAHWLSTADSLINDFSAGNTLPGKTIQSYVEHYAL